MGLGSGLTSQSATGRAGVNTCGPAMQKDSSWPAVRLEIVPAGLGPMASWTAGQAGQRPTLPGQSSLVLRCGWVSTAPDPDGNLLGLSTHTLTAPDRAQGATLPTWGWS